MNFLKELLLAIVCAAVPVITGYAVSFLRKAGEQAATNADNIKIQTYMKEITAAITDAVTATSQTYVDALKKAGAFTKEAQAEAANKALSACVSAISPAAERFILDTYGDLTDYLSTRIEAEVRKQKTA